VDRERYEPSTPSINPCLCPQPALPAHSRGVLCAGLLDACPTLCRLRIDTPYLYPSIRTHAREPVSLCLFHKRHLFVHTAAPHAAVPSAALRTTACHALSYAVLCLLPCLPRLPCYRVYHCATVSSYVLVSSCPLVRYRVCLVRYRVATRALVSTVSATGALVSSCVRCAPVCPTSAPAPQPVLVRRS
jgi:hypothetical protein